MPEFSGSTDEKHVSTLPSEIDSVRWDRRRAAPGGIVGLAVQTIFCGEGSQIEIKLEDAQGTVHATLSGTLTGNRVGVELKVPEKAKGGLLAKVKMPNHGLSAESEALKVVEPVRLRSARWPKETVQRGDIVTLSAEARGAQDGRRAVVQIYERDPAQGAHDPVTQLRPRVEGEAVTVKYRFQYPGDTSDILPEWEAPDGYRQPEFFYKAEVSGVRVDSRDARSRGVVAFVDDLTLQVVDAESGAPYADQDVEITLADGSTKTKTTDGNGVIELSEVPPGPAKVSLPELGAPAEKAEEEESDASGKAGASEEGEALGGAAAEEVYVRAAPNQTPDPATVATGSPARIRVERERGIPTL